MGIDGIRVGGGRCPPLAVGILLLISFLLVCNWWSLSTENTELLYQIDQLHEELRLSLDDKDKCAVDRNNLEKQYKHSEDELGALHVRLQQQSEIKKRNDEITDLLTVCKGELDSLKMLDATKTATLDALRLKENVLTEKFDHKREEAQKLQVELEKVKNELNDLNKTCNVRATQKVPEADNTSREEVMSNIGREDEMDYQNKVGDLDAPSPDDPVVKHVMQKKADLGEEAS